eukprot:3937930-Rhodomonas_salina.2
MAGIASIAASKMPRRQVRDQPEPRAGDPRPMIIPATTSESSLDRCCDHALQCQRVLDRSVTLAIGHNSFDLGRARLCPVEDPGRCA